MKPYRCRSNWECGDLPAPFMEGDVIGVPDGAAALERMNGMGPGLYIISYATSIDEGDAWYFRLSARRGDTSDRLHVIYAERCDSKWCSESVNWLEGCTLVSTKDPDGLAEREAMIAAGWKPPHHEYCPTCGQETRSAVPS